MGQDERDRLVEVATRLFAELGYDQTESAQIAGAAGLPPDAVQREFGGRRELYLEVFRQVQEAENALLEAYTKGGLDREGCHRFIDDYIGYSLDHPEHAALWSQRRLNDAADLREVEHEFVVPQVVEALRAFAAVFRDDVDSELMMWTVAWTLQAFTLASRSEGSPFTDDPSVTRFRTHLHGLVDRALK
ncbi:TetR/AcrR family transcriptional regulator [Actinocorallia sp. A-T 12471]|uniref:TetR/AcrR family transcriptional regulator n=1 Tax=Actinocorallia sp. A-T 12471 TaxID=3089813 RepID=UPI0029D1E463|nr:TetR/AcrR family transcriptional regulator [Actinocorallia sp. A-T 12471]MDX6740894.1 TetR/AcrR family transcriptional regulator [Actinocorallia sp. A-T 12471]